MSVVRKLQDIIRRSISNEFFGVEIFCRSLYLFVFLKILASWPLLNTIVVYAPTQLNNWWNKFVFAPLYLLEIGPHVFMITALLVTGSAIFIRLNYLTSFLVFWVSVSLSKAFVPILNGSDLVLNLFLLLAILIPAYPFLKWRAIHDYQKYLSIFFVLLIKVQVALIYFLSGYDKLITESWRTGAAVFSISNLDFFSNPVFDIELSKNSALLIAWLIIVFELAFPVLIWLQRFRKYLLLISLFFHFAIIIFLGLLDFGILMIITYSIFLPISRKDFKQVLN
jgi:hypothetical protein